MRPLAHLLLLAALVSACNQSESRTASSELAVQGQGPDTAFNTQQRRLLAAATIALPPEGLASESLPGAGSTGARLLSEFCTQCHALPSPAMHGAVDWPAVSRRMWVRIDMMRGQLGVRIPSEAERVQLLTYLTANALAVPASLPAGAGRDVFSTVCSRCHVLPDPRVHSPPDWPTVVTRMERNMEKMKVSGVTHDQAQAIITYLQTASRRR